MTASAPKFHSHQHPLHILIVDDQPESSAQIKSAIENIPDASYKLSFVDEVSALKELSFYNYDVCIVDNDTCTNSASELINQHHLGEKLPTIVYGDSTLAEFSQATNSEVHDVLNPDALNPVLIEHVIQHAYSQFHFEKKLADLAFTDELTELASKSMFEYQLDVSVKRAKHTHQSLSVGLFNINHFKQINKQFGFVMGNAVLNFFANIITDSVRPYDCVARFEGDTFAVIFEEANQGSALKIARDIETACQSGFFSHGLAVPFSFSFGLVECQSQSLVSLILNQAQRALYDAKHSHKQALEKDLIGEILDTQQQDILENIGIKNTHKLH
jgi:diguanylate cyclase (GGDEF)-like protein